MPNRSAPRVRRAALTGIAAAVLSCTVLSGTASAKSGAYVQVSAHAVRLAQSVQVTAYGGDDSVAFTYTCLQERIGNGGWNWLGCSARPWVSYTRSVRAESRSRLQFRAVLLKRYGSGPRVVDRVSSPANVLVGP